MTDTARSPGSAPAADRLIAVDRGAGELRRGRIVAISASGGDILATAAEGLSDGVLARLGRWSNGVPVLALTERRAAVLHIPPTGFDPVLIPLGGQFDAALARGLADPTADLAQPLRGPFTRDKAQPMPAAAAAIALCKRAHLLPAAVIAPINNSAEIIARHSLLTVGADDIFSADTDENATLRVVTSARVPLDGAENTCIFVFRPEDGSLEHLAIVIGNPPTDAPVLTRVHSACLTGDILGSLRCDCGEQLRGAIAAIASAGGGVVLYLAQEGRGIGLVNKLRAYRLQDEGFDTIEANERLGFEADERLFQPAAEMLRRLGFAHVRLLTNNPAKVDALGRLGITVTERVPHAFPPNNHNESYLAAKKRRSGHHL